MSTPPPTPPSNDDQPEGGQTPSEPTGGSGAPEQPPAGGAPVWGQGAGGGQPSGQPTGQPGGGSGGGTGLEPNIAAMLSYVLGWVTGLIFLFMEKENAEVRFHAAQSVIVFGALSVLWAVLSVLLAVPVLNLIIVFIIWPLLGLGGLIAWIFLLIQGYQLKHTKFPIAGGYAETLATKVGV